MKPLYVKKNGTVNKVSGVAMPNTFPANRVGYDNTTSELEATNTQDAIDEVVDIVADKVDKVTGKGLSTNDYDNTDKAKVGKIDDTTTTVTGNPISISGLKSNQLAINPVITLEPIQAGSGDPSPSNVRVISGYDKIEVLSCGKNLIDYNLLPYSGNGITLKEGANHELVIDGTATADFTPSFCRKYKNELKLGVYTISTQTGGNMVFVNAYNGDTFVRTLIEAYTQIFTLDFSDYDNIYIGIYISNGSTSTTNYIQLEEGSSVTAYEAPIKTTDLSLQIGQTVYGGTLDVEKGILTVDTGYDSYKWSDGTNVAEYTYCIAKSYILSSHTVSNASTGYGDESITNIATYDHNFYHDNPHYYIQNGDNLILFLAKEASADTDIQVAYKLETPFTIQLTPHEISLLKDYAYVSTNGTNMQLSYKNGEVASLGDVAQLGETVNLLGRETTIQINTLTSRTPNNITARLSMLPTAVSEQNLEKYGYKIGDYFMGTSQVSNNFRYWLADMDTFYGGYDYYAVESVHHIGIVVDTMQSSQWYTSSDITDVGYNQSTLHSYLSGSALDIIKADMIALFGGSTGLKHLLGHTKLWNKLGNWYWSDENTHSQYIAALTECQLAGAKIWSADNYQQGEGHKQLNLFVKYCFNQIFGWTWIWLRSIASSGRAVIAYDAGRVNERGVADSARAAGLILFH